MRAGTADETTLAYAAAPTFSGRGDAGAFESSVAASRTLKRAGEAVCLFGAGGRARNRRGIGAASIAATSSPSSNTTRRIAGAISPFSRLCSRRAATEGRRAGAIGSPALAIERAGAANRATVNSRSANGIDRVQAAAVAGVGASSLPIRSVAKRSSFFKAAPAGFRGTMAAISHFKVGAASTRGRAPI